MCFNRWDKLSWLSFGSLVGQPFGDPTKRPDESINPRSEGIAGTWTDSFDYTRLDIRWVSWAARDPKIT